MRWELRIQQIKITRCEKVCIYMWQNGSSLTPLQLIIVPLFLSPFCSVHIVLSSPILCDLMDYTVHGILQARILEWVAFPFSRGSSRPRNQTGVSCIADRFFPNCAIREAKNCKSTTKSIQLCRKWTKYVRNLGKY